MEYVMSNLGWLLLFALCLVTIILEISNIGIDDSEDYDEDYNENDKK